MLLACAKDDDDDDGDTGTGTGDGGDGGDDGGDGGDDGSGTTGGGTGGGGTGGGETGACVGEEAEGDPPTCPEDLCFCEGPDYCVANAGYCSEYCGGDPIDCG